MESEWGGGREVFQFCFRLRRRLIIRDVNRDGETLGRRMGFTDVTYTAES